MWCDKMWQNSIEYRYNLGIDNDVTFGTEIEFIGAYREAVRFDLMKGYLKKRLHTEWLLENDETLCNEGIFSAVGGEAISGILRDDKIVWQDIKFVCDSIKLNGGGVNDKCGAHVHVGVNIFDNNFKYYARFIKLWTVYENIIVRFCYGENEFARSMLYYFAASNRNIFKHIDLFYKNDRIIRSFEEFIQYYSTFKNLMVSFKGMSKEWIMQKYHNPKNWEDYRTLEFRLANGTLNHVIWQNYVNLYTKMMLCCLDDSKDWDNIDRLFYHNIHCDSELDTTLDNVRLFCDFVFYNDIDKSNFLLQYYKSDLEFGHKLIKKVNRIT